MHNCISQEELDELNELKKLNPERFVCQSCGCEFPKYFRKNVSKEIQDLESEGVKYCSKCVECEFLLEENNELRRVLKNAKLLIKKLQWSPPDDDRNYSYCELCGNNKKDDHRRDCEILQLNNDCKRLGLNE